MNLSVLQKYEFSNIRLSYLSDHHKRLLQHINMDRETNEKQEKSKMVNIHTSDPTWIKPNDTNPLFWHLYQEKNGLDCNMIFNKEQTESDDIFKMIEYIKANSVSSHAKSLLRKHKLNIKDIINELACSLKVNMNTFIALNIAFELPLIIKRNSFCIVYHTDNNLQNTYYVLNYDNCELYHEKTNIPDMFIGHHIESPLKSVSCYKLDELQSIAKQMNLSITKCNGKNKTKNELYTDIETHIWN